MKTLSCTAIACQVAGAHADEGVARAVLAPAPRRRCAPSSARFAFQSVRLGGNRWCFQEFGPLLKPNSAPSSRSLQPVGAALLLVGRALRQVGGRADLLVDDRPVADRRPDHGVAPPGQRGDQVVKRGASDHGRGRGAHSRQDYASSPTAGIGVDHGSPPSSRRIGLGHGTQLLRPGVRGRPGPPRDARRGRHLPASGPSSPTSLG